VVLAVLHLVCVLFSRTESPRWLMMVGRQDDARAMLQKLRRTADVTEEFQELKDAVEQ
jgi:SP family facilitated glucose transporter-like MFS transporter 1/SP family facilitated glucose transporter-like MFS transporter 3